MIAVSNTTPLRYLIAIEQENLLGQLFEAQFVPPAVHAELTDARTQRKSASVYCHVQSGLRFVRYN